jgi:hypothetical protein
MRRFQNSVRPRKSCEKFLGGQKHLPTGLIHGAFRMLTAFE